MPVVLVDNSQGHAAFGPDALRVTDMNLGPGGGQRKLRNGCYMREGVRVSQPMVYPDSHSKYPGAAKGIEAVLEERGLWPNSRLLRKCKGTGCPADGTNCCASRLLSIQPDFMEQKSLVQETIEANGEYHSTMPSVF